MTYSGIAGDKFDFIPVDLSNPVHSEFVYDLIAACRAEMLDDYCNNIPMAMEAAHQGILNHQVVGSLVVIETQAGPRFAGAIWIEIDRNDIAKIHGGLLPEFRCGFLAIQIFREFIRQVFQYTALRKIEGWMPLNCRGAEAVLRWCGFTKEGLIKEAYTINGEPHPLVLLGLTRRQFEGIQNGKRTKGRLNGNRGARRR